MNLRQLRYIHEIATSDFNISRAAKTLNTNQPGISKQVRMLEDELGFSIFRRRRSRLSGLTSEGAKVAAMADNVMREGLGIAVLSEVTYDAKHDTSLRAIPAGHLFEPSVTKILLSRERYVRPCTYDFIELCAPRWTKSNVQQSMTISPPATH